MTTGAPGQPGSTTSGPTIALMKEINAAFNSRDVDRIMSFFTDDCTFYMARGPEPCGRRVHGKTEVRRALADRFKVIPDMRWDHVDHFIAGNRAVTVWMVTGRGAHGEVLSSAKKLMMRSTSRLLKAALISFIRAMVGAPAVIHDPPCRRLAGRPTLGCAGCAAGARGSSFHPPRQSVSVIAKRWRSAR